MRTINFNQTYDAQVTDIPVMDLKVTRARQMVFHALMDDANGGTLKFQYVFTDPETRLETLADYHTKPMVAGTLVVLDIQYKVDNMRVTYSSTGAPAGGATPTIRVTGTTAQ
tara:strand:- start:4860 stop:5195 length:336 start_codon:yes stop_codon:yes gene_type:complete